MTENELVGIAPMTKAGIQSLSHDLIAPVLDGEVDPVVHACRLKAIQESVKRALDDDRMKDAVITETERHGKERTWNGATVRVKEVGVSYDYSLCGDPVYADMARQREELDRRMKEREAYLRTVPPKTTVVDDRTGEIYEVNPAVRMARMGYTITFGK